MEHLSPEAKKIIESSSNREELLEIAAFTKKELDQLSIGPTELQWTILINHLNEMVKRCQNEEKLENVDITLFTEVSSESIDLARKIAEKIGSLPIEEAYVLSIHFETAKFN